MDEARTSIPIHADAGEILRGKTMEGAERRPRSRCKKLHQRAPGNRGLCSFPAPVSLVDVKLVRALVFVLLARFAVAQEPMLEAAALDVLIVAPHPDDETIGCAGVTLQALARGERVGIV